MKIERLALKGILRFEEPVALDLHDVPPGLVAVVGPNGSGKTTLLEAGPAALYRRFASRGDRDLVDYATGRDSYLETEFSLDGRGLFRARVNLDHVRRSSDAVLEQIHPDGTRTVLNDGKVSTFDAVVAETVPPRDLVLASAFAAQNRAGSFVTLDKKGRKALFSRLLGLDHLEEMSQTARTAASLVEAARGRVVAVRDTLAREAGPEVDQALAAQDETLAAFRAAADADRARLADERVDLEARLALVQDHVAACAAATLRMRSLDADLRARQVALQQIRTARTAADRDRASEEDRLEAAHTRGLADLQRRRDASDATREAERERATAALEATFQDLDTRLANNRAVLAAADDIRAAVARLAEIDALLATQREAERHHQEALRAIEVRDRDLLADLTAAEQAERDRQRAEQDCALLATVPCCGTGEFSGCRFLANAQAAQTRLPGLAERAAPRADLQRQRTDLAHERERARREGEDLTRAVRALEAEQREVASRAALAPTMDAAEERIADLTRRRAEAGVAAEQAQEEVDQRAAERARDLDEHRAALDARIADDRTAARARHNAQAADLDAQIDAGEAALAQVEAQFQEAVADLAATEAGHQQARRLQDQLAVLRQQWDDTTAALARVAAGEQEAAARRQALEARRAELAELHRRIAALETDLVEWQLLGRALGRDGLPVLEIDAAGPTVSAVANDLLAECYGPRFTVDLVTQEAKASGKGMKESFELKVWDNDRGGEARDLSDLSGGEQVIVDEALKNALAIYSNARSPVPMRTCWRDETTGPLDPENAARYVPMLRKVRELGGFHHVFFVSHNPEAAAVADAQLRVDAGRVHAMVPPYTR